MNTAHKSIYKVLFHCYLDCFNVPMLTLGRKAVFDSERDFEGIYPPDALPLTYATHDIVALDMFDPRAHLRYDLNYPVPEREHEVYQTIVDIGTLEHVFDTRACLENCFRMLAPGGHYFLVAPVKGYFGHGFHTFNPELVDGVLAANHFDIKWRYFADRDGKRGLDHEDVSIFVLARKLHRMVRFVPSQQACWRTRYDEYK
jgi:hypothetical protein